MDKYIDPKLKWRAQGGGYYLQARATYYPSFARVYIPNHAVKLATTNSLSSGSSDFMAETFNQSEETVLERSLRRTRKNVKDIVFCNKFDHFVTLTIASDRQNIMRSKAKVSNWIKNEKKRKGKFDYIMVPEFHKDGESLHFHALFKDYKGELKRSYKANGKAVVHKRRNVYEYPSYTSGFSTIELVDNSVGSIAKVGFYLQKYITKDMPIIFGKNRYHASRGLKRPVITDNPEPWYEVVKPDREYENEHGKILEFDAGKQAIVDIFIEANQP